MHRTLCGQLCKTAELIERPFAMWTREGPENHVLDSDAHWHNLVNATEPSVSGGNAALLSSRISLDST